MKTIRFLWLSFIIILICAVPLFSADTSKKKSSARESRAAKDAPRQGNEDLCNYRAKEHHSAIFGNISTSKANKSMTYGYISHYNKKRSTCYILMWAKDADGVSKNLEDVYEKVNIGSMFWKQEYIETMWCVVEDKRCNFNFEFEKLIKPYMTQ